MDENIYKKVYPTGASEHKFYGLPKIQKEDVPLRPIVSSIGSVTYGVHLVLACADYTKPFLLETDASKDGLEAVLFLKQVDG